MLKLLPRSFLAKRAAFAGAGLLLAAGLALAPVAAASSVTVIVNGQTMSFDQPPIVQAGRVFVPLRGVFQQLGASVVYANGQINATGAGRNVSLTIGSTNATVNGQAQQMDVAPFVVGQRTLVPLRFVAQALGATVNWNNANSTVTINGGGAVAPMNSPAVRFVSVVPRGTLYNVTAPQISFRLSRPTQIGLITVMLDGRNVTGSVAQNGPASFTFTPPFGLQPMAHVVRVYGSAIGGMRFDLRWTFRTS